MHTIERGRSPEILEVGGRLVFDAHVRDGERRRVAQHDGVGHDIANDRLGAIGELLQQQHFALREHHGRVHSDRQRIGGVARGNGRDTDDARTNRARHDAGAVGEGRRLREHVGDATVGGKYHAASGQRVARDITQRGGDGAEGDAIRDDHRGIDGDRRLRRVRQRIDTHGHAIGVRRVAIGIADRGDARAAYANSGRDEVRDPINARSTRRHIDLQVNRGICERLAEADRDGGARHRGAVLASTGVGAVGAERHAGDRDRLHREVRVARRRCQSYLVEQRVGRQYRRDEIPREHIARAAGDHARRRDLGGRCHTGHDLASECHHGL